jgi:Flp pilus assembly protein TadG
MRSRSRSFSRNDSGTVMVLTSMLMVVFLGFAALVIDIGHLYVVRNELQNAADAGALAGATNLAPYIIATSPIPDWDSAQAAAESTTKANRTDNTLITDCQVQPGYFNLVTREMQSSTIAATSVDVPAVRVNVARAEGQNNGPVLPFLARIFGINL